MRELRHLQPFTLLSCLPFSTAYFFSMCFTGLHLSFTSNLRMTERLVSLLLCLSLVVQKGIITDLYMRLYPMQRLRRARAKRANSQQTWRRKSYLAPADVQMKIVDVGVGGQAREESSGDTKQPSKGGNNRGGAPKEFHVSLFQCSSDNWPRQDGAFFATVYKVLGKRRQHFWKATGTVNHPSHSNRRNRIASLASNCCIASVANCNSCQTQSGSKQSISCCF